VSAIQYRHAPLSAEPAAFRKIDYGLCVLPLQPRVKIQVIGDFLEQGEAQLPRGFSRDLQCGLKEYLVCRHQNGPERCHVTCNRHAASRSHHADSTTAPLAARASTSDLQDHRPDLLVFDWPGTGISGRRLSAYFRHQHAPTPIDRHSDVRRPTFK